jgi:XTP/dITP diphosphohydrolase
MTQKISPTRTFGDLVRIMEILRKECPWDREQTPESLKDLMVEEVYEAIDAIDRKQWNELAKELGDVLLHIVFQAEMAKEASHFDMGEVIYLIQEKLIRRHPHIFADHELQEASQVVQQWEQIKKKENPKRSILDGVPQALPGLIRAQRMQEKAAGVGFDWPDWQGAWEKLEEEIEELKSILTESDQQRKQEEFGDVLFSLVNVGRYFGLNAEDALRLTNSKFQRRFEHIEQRVKEKGKELHELSLEELDVFWDEAKRLQA